jgi:hypothetical protein
MSIPAWQYKLEEVEFKLINKPNLIVDWLLNNPVAKEIPEHIVKARLARYGYKEPEPEPVIKPFTTEERKASKTRAKRNRKDAE